MYLRISTGGDVYNTWYYQFATLQLFITFKIAHVIQTILLIFFLNSFVSMCPDPTRDEEKHDIAVFLKKYTVKSFLHILSMITVLISFN